MTEIEALVCLGRTEGLIRLAEELLVVRDRKGRLCALRANAAQRRFEERRGAENVVLKARQMGMTTWTAARFFLKTVTRPGTLTLLVAQSREAAEQIFASVHRFWEHLPEDMKAGPLRLKRASAGQLVFGEIDSEYRVASAGEAGVGRGMSVQNLHVSELSRWPGDAAGAFAGLRAALAPGGELIVESTPNGAYGSFYEAWCESGMVRHFLPWWLEPSYSAQAAEGVLTAEECRLVEREGLSAEQIGFRRELERRYGVLRSQEFAEDAESCFRATGSCCFDADAIEARLREVPPPMEMRSGGALRVWLPAMAGREYVIGVDPAGGGADGDFAGVQVLEVRSGLQCAELQQRLRPAELAKAVAELAREYNDARVAVERNNHGAAVIAYIETVQRGVKLYREAGEAGWLTTASNKPAMVARVGQKLMEGARTLMSERLLRECLRFVTDDRGRSSAAAGAHDDLVMAMAVAESVRAEMVGHSHEV